MSDPRRRALQGLLRETRRSRVRDRLPGDGARITIDVGKPGDGSGDDYDDRDEVHGMATDDDPEYPGSVNPKPSRKIKRSGPDDESYGMADDDDDEYPGRRR